ncbi:hypothetical protein GCM10009097_25470 [Pigmentiphaga daeguensis]|uniref:Uncharacterized protein n=1 Tax=Pigmentiphaga daeguensis TaxID=414049 RepID=A0ABN1BWX0_9BURK
MRRGDEGFAGQALDGQFAGHVMLRQFVPRGKHQLHELQTVRAEQAAACMRAALFVAGMQVDRFERTCVSEGHDRTD